MSPVKREGLRDSYLIVSRQQEETGGKRTPRVKMSKEVFLSGATRPNEVRPTLFQIEIFLLEFVSSH